MVVLSLWIPLIYDKNAYKFLNKLKNIDISNEFYKKKNKKKQN